MRALVAAGKLFVKFISTDNQIADALTKPLSTVRFAFLCNKLSVTASAVPLDLGG